jgi:hypothetical protein
MGPVRNGVQWTSRVISRTRTPALFAAPALSLSIVPGPTPADAATDKLQLSRSVCSRVRSTGDLYRSSYLARRIAFARRLTPQIPSRPRDDPPGPPLRAGVTSDAPHGPAVSDQILSGGATRLP